MSSSIYSSTSNYSLYAIPAAWICALAPHAFAASKSKVFDNRSPRTYTKLLESDQTIDQATKEMILRAEGAQINGFENLGLFATSILAGNFANLPASTLNGFAAAYLASRVAYNVIYISNTSEMMANARSVVFVGGVGLCMTLFVKAGNVMMNTAASNLL